MFLNSYKKALDVVARKPFVLWGLSLMSGLLSILVMIMFGAIPAIGTAVTYIITCGMAKVYLDGLKGKEVYSDQLFAGFNQRCFRIAGGMAWSNLWVLIWFLIPIAGPVIAIVKSYSYRFVPYILISRPEITATEALRISKKETEGLKGQMFLADICYFGGVFVLCFVIGLFSAIPILGVLFALVYAIVLILIVAFGPIFSGLYQAYFYEYRDVIARKPVYNNPNNMYNTNNAYNQNGMYNTNNSYNPNSMYNANNSYNPNGMNNVNGAYNPNTIYNPTNMNNVNNGYNANDVYNPTVMNNQNGVYNPTNMNNIDYR